MKYFKNDYALCYPPIVVNLCNGLLNYVVLGLVKMFLCWILVIFNVQIQSEKGHKFLSLIESLCFFQEEMDSRFHISLSSTSLQYKACVVLYILAITVLLYYLADSILAKSKLTPRRIKIW